MYAPEPCGRLWDNNGDWRPCYLVDNHDQSCADANHQATLDSLQIRTWEAQQKDPWL